MEFADFSVYYYTVVEVIKQRMQIEEANLYCVYNGSMSHLTNG